MPASFTLFPNDFNIGKDVSGRLYDDSGASKALSQIGHLLESRVELRDTIIRKVPITNGGIPLIETIWEGGSLHLRFTRARGNVEYMTLQAMQNFFQLDLRPNFSFAWRIANKDGSIDQFLGIGMKLTRPDLGRFSGTTDVEQSLTFEATQFKWVGPNAPVGGASPLSF